MGLTPLITWAVLDPVMRAVITETQGSSPVGTWVWALHLAVEVTLDTGLKLCIWVPRWCWNASFKLCVELHVWDAGLEHHVWAPRGVEMLALNSVSSFMSETRILSFTFRHSDGIETQFSNSVSNFACEMWGSSSVSEYWSETEMRALISTSWHCSGVETRASSPASWLCTSGFD